MEMIAEGSTETRRAGKWVTCGVILYAIKFLSLQCQSSILVVTIRRKSHFYTTDKLMVRYLDFVLPSSRADDETQSSQQWVRPTQIFADQSPAFSGKTGPGGLHRPEQDTPLSRTSISLSSCFARLFLFHQLVSIGGTSLMLCCAFPSTFDLQSPREASLVRATAPEKVRYCCW